MSYKKIALIRFSSIGDIVLTLPVVHLLRKQWPEAELHFITKRLFHDLLSGETTITKFHLLDKNESLRSMKSELVAEQFDLIVDLHDNLRSRYLTLGVGVQVVRYQKERLRRLLYLYLKKREFVVPVWRRYLNAVDGGNSEPDFSLSLPEKVHHSVDKLLPNTPFLVIAPGSTWATKEWPLERYRELAPLLSEGSFKVVVVGGEKDRKVQDVIQEQLSDRLISLAGELTIAESAAVVARASLLLTVDTGMMHIGSAFNRPALVLFGSTVKEFGFFPASSKARVFEQDLPCRPCSHTGKKTCPKKHHRCMNNVSAEVIATAVIQHFLEIRDA